MNIDGLITLCAGRWASQQHLFVVVRDDVWLLKGCSPISGQLSFRRFTGRVNPKGLRDNHALKMENYKDAGVSPSGWILPITKRVPRGELQEKMDEAARLLGISLEKKTFLGSEGDGVYITDGKRGMGLDAWHSSVVAFDFPRKEPSKCYQIILDPVLLSPRMRILTPFETVIERIKGEPDVFIDPLAIRNLSKQNVIEYKHILTPDLRQQQRKRTVVRKKKEGS